MLEIPRLKHIVNGGSESVAYQNHGFTRCFGDARCDILQVVLESRKFEYRVLGIVGLLFAAVHGISSILFVADHYQWY